MKNEQYSISIIEPWDYVSPDGKNVINGSILKIVDENCILFKSNYTCKFQTLEGDVFVLTNRSSLDKIADLNDGFFVVNGSLIDSEFQLDEKVEILKASSKRVLIGSLRRKQSNNELL